MRIIRLEDQKELLAGDGSVLRELLNPEKQSLPISYSLARAVAAPGQKTLRHRLAYSEVYYIVSGNGLMHIDDETAEIREADAVYIPPGAVQYIENTGDDDLVFLCIVQPAWRQGIEEILE